MSGAIQEQFGSKVIEAFADFARADLKQPSALAADEFAHVKQVKLREAIASAFYGVRWIYKLGLALLTRDEERAAHIRAQITDYTSICEALLSYCVERSIVNKYAKGTAYLYRDAGHQQPIDWKKGNPTTILGKQSLWWLVTVASEIGIVNSTLHDDLHWLRKERNAVHIRQRVTLGAQAYLNQSRRAYELVYETIRQTKVWCATHS